MTTRIQYSPWKPSLSGSPAPFFWLLAASFTLLIWRPASAQATPANKAALDKHYERFLPKNLNQCTTCHLPSTNKSPASLDEFPHNPFGQRLRLLGEELSAAGKKRDIPVRLGLVAREDTDGDGNDNETEILLGRAPGDGSDKPTAKELQESGDRLAEFAKFLQSYRWQPFEMVKRPAVPTIKNSEWARNPIDRFIAAEHEAQQLKPRPQAPRHILLRRAYLDLIGLSPTPDELNAFENDTSLTAYEQVVERLLADPRYGERWGRHWMDVWRYSDWAGWTDGGQIRDSQPHIWRWRDWIVESLNHDKAYDRMVVEMLAADELAPEDTDALRATGYLARNFKMLSREQWLEDTINHTSKAFLGLTVHCAKCHNHLFDPISQNEYYQMRAIFEPHRVRIDRIPGQFDTKKDGLARAYDADLKAPTWFFVRGDERRPDTNNVVPPGVPKILGGSFDFQSAVLPRLAYLPDKREFVITDTIAASQQALTDARKALAAIGADAKATSEKRIESESNVILAEARYTALLTAIRAERLEDDGRKDSDEWMQASSDALIAQRKLVVLEAKEKLRLAKRDQAVAQTKADESARALESTSGDPGDKPATSKIAAQKKAAEKAAKDLEAAEKKFAESAKALAAAETELNTPPASAHKPRPMDSYPATSTGRRLAFARWVASPRNPLTARVAMNHLWLRHFGRGIVPTPADFGRNGRAPSHPQLLDWLAAEFTAQDWSMKAMHRMIVTSSTYRMASTSDDTDARIDPDNVYLWRMPSRRMEAEAVRDNLLQASGNLDAAMGGPEIDQKFGLTSKRRSIYLRIAAEKEVEFLKIFDSPSVTECYERMPSVMPQQALALANSELTLAQARALAGRISADAGNDSEKFIAAAFQRTLARAATEEERRLCREFLKAPPKSSNVKIAAPLTAASLQELAAKSPSDSNLHARENLILVLFNHNDFVTIR